MSRLLRKTKLRKANIAPVEVSTFKRDVYKLMYKGYEKKYDLKQCVVLLGDLKSLNTKEFIPTKKLQQYLRSLRNADKLNTVKTKHDVFKKKPRAHAHKTARLEVSKDKDVKKSHSKTYHKDKSSSKVVPEHESKTSKAVFEKNLMISDDSENETESQTVAKSNSRMFRKTAFERALELTEDHDDEENTRKKQKSNKNGSSITRKENQSEKNEENAKEKQKSCKSGPVTHKKNQSKKSETNTQERQKSNRNGSVTRKEKQSEKSETNTQEKQKSNKENQTEKSEENAQEKQKSNKENQTEKSKENAQEKQTNNKNSVTETHGENQSEKSSSIIQLAFEKALIAEDDAQDQQTPKTTGAKVFHLFGSSFIQHYKCGECGETFDDCFKLKRHMMVHKMKLDEVEKKPTLSCYICLRKFSERNALWSHMRMHALDRQTLYRCRKCNVGFKASRDLNAHKSACCGSSKSSDKNVSSAKSSGDSAETFLKYRCNICKRKFADVLQMRKHKKIHSAQQASSGEHTVVATTSHRTTVFLDKIVTTMASPANTASLENKNTSEQGRNNTTQKQIPAKDKQDQVEKKTSDSVTQKDKTTTEITQAVNIQIPDGSKVAELKPQFKCCQKVFAERNELFLHMKDQIKMPNGIVNCDPVYVCSVCSTEYNERLEWYRHCKSRHKNLYRQKASKSVVKIRKPRYACGTCYMKFDSISKLQEHKLVRHLSINSLQRTTSRDATVKLNDLRVEFEQIFCPRTTDDISQEDDVDDDMIILDDNGSDVSESELLKDNTEAKVDQPGVTLVKAEENIELSSTPTSQSEKDDIPVDSSASLSNEKVKETVRYRCDICDDVFEDPLAFLEHEEFHKEIEVPVKTSKKKRRKRRKAEKRKSLDMPDLFSEAPSDAKIACSKTNADALPQQQQKPQKNKAVNHINIAVNLPSVINKTVNDKSVGTSDNGDQNVSTSFHASGTDVSPQQNLVTILIANSDSSVMPGFNVFTQSPVLYQSQFPSQNQNISLEVNNSNFRSEGQIKLSKGDITKQSSDIPLVITDVRSMAEPPVTAQPSPAPSQVITDVRSVPSSSPLRAQDKKVKNSEAIPPLRWLAENTKAGEASDKDELFLVSVLLPDSNNFDSDEIQVLSKIPLSNKVTECSDVNKDCCVNITEAMFTSQNIPYTNEPTSSISCDNPVTYGEVPVILKHFSNKNSSVAKKQMSIAAHNQSAENLTVATQSSNLQTDSTDRFAVASQHLTSQNFPLNQLMVTSQGSSLNQILPASSHTMDKPIDINQQYSVISQSINNQPGVSSDMIVSYPQLAAVLTGQVDTADSMSGAAMPTITSVRSLNSNEIPTFSANRENRLIAPASKSVNVRKPYLGREESNKPKLNRMRSATRERLKQMISEFKLHPRTFRKISSNEVIVLSDDSNDGESSSAPQTQANEKELPSENPQSIIFQGLQSKTFDELVETNKEISALNSRIETTSHTSQEIGEKSLDSHVVFKNRTKDSSSLAGVDNQEIPALKEQIKYGSVASDKQNYISSYESFLDHYEPVPTRPRRPPRIFVRNIKDLMDPQCKPPDLDDTNKESVISEALVTKNVSVEQDEISTATLSISQASVAADVIDTTEVESPPSLPESPATEDGSSSTSEHAEQEERITKQKHKYVPTQCEDCKIVFKKQRSFRRHMRITKMKNRCSRCDYHTCSRHCLKSHYQSKHNPKFMCYHCMLVFTTYEELVSHNEVHRCPRCLSIFTHLHVHLQKCTGIDNVDSAEAVAPVGGSPSETTVASTPIPDPNETESVRQETAQVAPELPVLRDELSVLEDT